MLPFTPSGGARDRQGRPGRLRRATDGEGPLAVLGIVTPEDAERDHVRHRFRGPGLG